MLDPTDHERFARLRNAWEEVVEAPEGGRDSILERLREESPEFAADLARLLADHLANEHDGFMEFGEDLATSVVAAASPEAHSGWPERLGRYRIVRRLGSGGTADVFEGRAAPPIDRRVAIKVLHQRHGTEERQRFEVEQRILQRLDHPGIAAVLDAGVTEDGRRPYSVIEYVEGVSITEWCTRTQPEIDEILRLLVQLCEAVGHAHQHGVIHRDLAPSNVLVGHRDGVPIIRLVDFGIARWDHASHDRTAPGQILGTLRWMAPEQLHGELVDARADVHAIGLLAFRLLGERHAFTTDGDRLPDLVRAIEGPERRELVPSTRHRAWRGDVRDLQAVVRQAMRANASERYASVHELELDLRAVLRRSAVLARRRSAVAEVSAWVRRHRGTTAVAGLGVLVLVGLAGRLVSEGRAKVRRGEHLEAIVDEFAGEILSEASRLEGTHRVRMAIGDGLDRHLETIRREIGDTAERRRVHARVLLELASTHEQAGDPVASLAPTERAIELLGGLANEFPGHLEVRRAWLEARIVRGDRIRHGGDPALGAAVYREVHQELLALHASDPDAIGPMDDLGWSHARLANLSNDLDERRSDRDAFLRLARRLVSVSPERDLSHLALSTACLEAATDAFHAKDGPRWRGLVEEGLEIARSRSARDPRDLRWQRQVVLHARLAAWAPAIDGDGDRAIEMIEDAIARTRSMLARDPGRADLVRLIQETLSNAREIAMALGRTEDEARYSEARRVHEERSGR